MISVTLSNKAFPGHLPLLILLMICQCHIPGMAQTAKGDPAVSLDKSYRLQSGDRLNIKIYPEDEYLKGGEAEISSEGNVTLPLIGKVAVGGKTVIEAEKVLTRVLAADYLVNPQVVIEVLEYQASQYVMLGEVMKPGTYEFPPGSTTITLLYAISIAGGFSEIANIKKIKVMRKSTGEVMRINAEDIISGRTRDIELIPNDVVHVSESLF